MGFFGNRMKEFSETYDVKTTNPIDLFYNQLIQQPKYDFLRDNQTAFLMEWDNNRRTDRDVVGVMNTGAGKTLIGLLMLYSKLQENVGPSLYLCPDVQLVEQVCNQAKLYGIPVCKLEKKPNERQEFPLEFLNNESILVTTFERLFNGKSIFGVSGRIDREIQKIGALLIDDAHECVKKAREQASIKIEKQENENLYNSMFELFKDDLKSQGIGALNSIQKGEKSVIKQIPYWAWESKIDTVASLIDKNNTKENLNIFFSYNLIADEIKNCECYINGEMIEITPLLIPTYKIPAFENAKHRYILSATLTNSYDLIGELGIDSNAIKAPININNINMGERLILAPKRYHIDITETEIRDLCCDYSKKYNVMVIVPNRKRAKLWTQKGAKLIDSDNIIQELDNLKSENQGNLYVVMNRYDGMDLIDDLCRILVIDGMPTKESLKENMEIQYRENSTLVNAKQAQIIEQGLGRGVRSGTDHCVSILMGNDLLKFIGTNKNKKFFSPIVQSQMDFGINLTKGEMNIDKPTALEYMKEAMNECLSANEEWRQFHKNMIVDAPRKYSQIKLEQFVDIVILERELFKAKNRNSITDIDKHMSEILGLVKDGSDKGWYHQIYAHLIHAYNPGRAVDLQIIANDLQYNLLRPLTFSKGKKVANRGNQIANFRENLSRYEKGTDICINIDSILAGMIYSPDMYYKTFEQSIKELGEFLGFASTRPDNETDDGPDNFWRMENTDLIIECKNNSINDISRDEANQMTNSMRWYKEIYNTEEKMTGVLLHNSFYVNDNAHVNGEFKVIHAKNLELLKSNIKKLGEILAQKAPEAWDVKELSELLNRFNLLEKNFVQYYATEVKNKKH